MVGAKRMGVKILKNSGTIQTSLIIRLFCLGALFFLTTPSLFAQQSEKEKPLKYLISVGLVPNKLTLVQDSIQFSLSGKLPVSAGVLAKQPGLKLWLKSAQDSLELGPLPLTKQGGVDTYQKSIKIPFLSWMEGAVLELQFFEGKNKEDFLNFTTIYELNKIQKIAIFGGDGTMHDIINAIMLKPEWLSKPLMLFPCGTGNAFCHDLDCLSVEKATQRLLNGKEMLVDLAEIKMSKNSMWAFNIVGCGLVSHINTLAEKMRYFGPARYNIATIMKIISPPVLTAKISFNGEIYTKDYCFTFGNVKPNYFNQFNIKKTDY